MQTPVDANFKEKLKGDLDVSQAILQLADALNQIVHKPYRKLKEAGEYDETPSIEKIESVYLPARKAATLALIAAVEKSGWANE